MHRRHDPGLDGFVEGATVVMWKWLLKAGVLYIYIYMSYTVAKRKRKEREREREQEK
jgi:hypothetical protein